MKRALSVNEVSNELADMRPGGVVEYWRGPTLKGCDYAWILWDMAMRGDVHLVQKKYAEFDFGYWAVKASLREPLSERMQFFGRDVRGRRARLAGDHPAPSWTDPLNAPDGGAGEVEGGLAGGGERGPGELRVEYPEGDAGAPIAL